MGYLCVIMLEPKKQNLLRDLLRELLHGISLHSVRVTMKNQPIGKDPDSGKGLKSGGEGDHRG